MWSIFFRKLAASLYDALILFCIFILATYAFLPFTHGQAVPAGNVAYRLYLLAIVFIFYTYFWWRRGQTLGMLAWRLKLTDEKGATLAYYRCALRFFLALFTLLPFGLGFWWMFFNKKHQALYDVWLSTKLSQSK